MRSARCLTILLFIALTPIHADARAMAVIAPRAIPMVIAPGVAIEAPSLIVRCVPAQDNLQCRIQLAFDARASLETESSVRVTPGYDRVTIDGRDEDTVTVPAGESVHVEILVINDFVTTRESAFLVADPLWMRHLLLAPRSPRLGDREAIAAAFLWTPFETSATPATQIPITIDDPSGRLSIEEGATSHRVLFRAAPASDTESFVRPGGPFLAAGALVEERDDTSYFAMRAGYEFGLHDWVVISGAIETDFVTGASLSIMAEVVSPAFFALVFGFPGFSGGIGAVLDLREEGARGAVRMSAGAQIMPAGVVGTFDFYPDESSWTMGLMGRLSL